MGNKQIIIKRWDNENIIIKTSKYKSILELIKNEKISYYRANLQGAYLQGAYLQGAYLQDAYLRGAYLQGANLQGANLQDAYLQDANLRGATLQDANLRGAYLQDAYLRGAYLQGADKYLILPDIYMLKMQSKNTKIKMWKYTDRDLKSPYQYYQYELKKEYVFNDYNDNENHSCGGGGNVATLQWCLKDSNDNDNLFLEVEFYIKDIIAIPYATDGKMRVKKFKTLRAIKRDKAIKLLNKEIGDKNK
jgi:hypothetical protein